MRDLPGPLMRKAGLRLPCLALITDRRLCQDEDDLVERVKRAVMGGVTMVQLREKDLPAGELLRLGVRLREAAEGRAIFVVNDRVDVALACGAQGVHLPEAGLPPRVARRLAEARLLIGRSVHSLEGAMVAETGGADYLEVGTIFPTSSHPNAVPAGVELLCRVKEKVSIPILAIGGVKTFNVGEVIRAGAAGAAVISAILATPDPQEAAQKLMEAMRAAWGEVD